LIKKCLEIFPGIFFRNEGLFFLTGLGSTNRADFGTFTAIFTFGRIDLELRIPFFDRSNRTLGLTSATADAVFTDFIGHLYFLLINNLYFDLP
jgi:hypothetical protein